MARRRKERALRQLRITVIGEGLTERWYFDHLRTVMGYRYDCKRKLIEWVLQNGGIAVCVCDADITRNNIVESQRLKEMKEYYSGNDRVVICDSMPSIEFWFLLHYLETSRNFNRSAEVAAVLRRSLPAFQKSGAFLEKVQWVAELCADNKLMLACERARAISEKSQSESYSNIFKAIDLFKNV